MCVLKVAYLGLQFGTIAQTMGSPLSNCKVNLSMAVVPSLAIALGLGSQTRLKAVPR
jgi:hypothetical protein